MLYYYLILPIAYLVGSVNTSIVLSRLRYRQDIRAYGSNNAGTTNVLRTYGKKAAALVLCLDMLKGVAVVVLARYLLPEGGRTIWVFLAGFFVMLGHIFPVFFRFRGGKGVATIAGVILALQPVYFLILLAFFVVILALTRYMSLTAILSGLLYPSIVFVGAYRNNTPKSNALIALLIGLTLVFTHRENIKRLLHHEERKFTFRKKEAAEQTQEV